MDLTFRLKFGSMKMYGATMFLSSIRHTMFHSDNEQLKVEKKKGKKLRKEEFTIITYTSDQEVMQERSTSWEISVKWRE